MHQLIANSGNNFLFSRSTDHNEKERKRFGATEASEEYSELNEDRMKQIDLIKKRQGQKNEVRAYMNNVDETMLEYYRIFVKQIKPLPPKPSISGSDI